MICYVLAMGKQHLGPHVVVGYGIKIFLPGLFITSPDHLAATLSVLFMLMSQNVFHIYRLTLHLFFWRIRSLENFTLVRHLSYAVPCSFSVSHINYTRRSRVGKKLGHNVNTLSTNMRKNVHVSALS